VGPDNIKAGDINMTDNSFDRIYSNNLQQVQMIAGDEQLFVYNVYDRYGNPLNLDNTSCSVVIFKYGDPSYIVAGLSGSLVRSGSSLNQFSVTFSGSALSNGGVYQQQVVIVDRFGVPHVPSQGRIVVFPSNAAITE
jgi:hypothetical protein